MAQENYLVNHPWMIFNASYGGLRLNIGITNSPVRDSLGILCNDFDQGGLTDY
jgi:hypothetical protein